jgi:protein phosphatase 1G
LSPQAVKELKVLAGLDGAVDDADASDLAAESTMALEDILPPGYLAELKEAALRGLEEMDSDDESDGEWEDVSDSENGESEGESGGGGGGRSKKHDVRVTDGNTRPTKRRKTGGPAGSASALSSLYDGTHDSEGPSTTTEDADADETEDESNDPDDEGDSGSGDAAAAAAATGAPQPLHRSRSTRSRRRLPGGPPIEAGDHSTPHTAGHGQAEEGGADESRAVADAGFGALGNDGEGKEEDEEPACTRGVGVDSGCTATVAIIGGGKIVCANAGDSRCLLSRRGTAVPLSFDHKPEDPIETARVKKAGGWVDAESGRVNDGLNLSRALGDHQYALSNSIVFFVRACVYVCVCARARVVVCVCLCMCACVHVLARVYV